MKLRVAEVVYSLYIKGSRFIAYFKKADDAMAYAAEVYPTEEKHVEPVFLMEKSD